jgi:hypothetical protein
MANVDSLDFDGLMEEPPAEDAVIPFGKYAGKTLGQVAATDEGLLYLDWAAGEWKGGFGDVVRHFMDDDVLREEVERLLEERV